jgi:hypothetical protein
VIFKEEERLNSTAKERAKWVKMWIKTRQELENGDSRGSDYLRE